MISKLNQDVLQNLAYYLDLFSILNLSLVDKTINLYLDDIFYKSYAIYVFGDIFWIKASMRPIVESKPLKTYKAELIRIETFQNVLDRLNYNRWTQKDFYNYWGI